MTLNSFRLFHSRAVALAVLAGTLTCLDLQLGCHSDSSSAGMGGGEGGSSDPGGGNGAGKSGGASGAAGVLGGSGAGGASPGTGGMGLGGAGGSSSGGVGGAKPQGGAAGSAVGGMTGGMTGGAFTPLVPGAMEPDYSVYDHDCDSGNAGQPVCCFKPTHPHPYFYQCGPLKDRFRSSATPRVGAPSWCGDTSAGAYTNDGVFQVGQTALEKLSNVAVGGWTAFGAAPIKDIYVPSAAGGYAAAKNGEVALTFWISAFSDQEFLVRQIHESLIAKGDMPYAIAVRLTYSDTANKAPEMISDLKTKIIPALKAQYPKISDDPDYRVIVGQSTAGAHAFDVMWMGTDVVSKAIGGSPSLACFSCMELTGSSDSPGANAGYEEEIKFCPKRSVRWSATVGTCDIMASKDERFAAGCCMKGLEQTNPLSCDAQTGKGDVDVSGCAGNWPTMNKGAAQAMKEKGNAYQLFVIEGGRHAPNTWGGVALSYQMRWIFKDVTCFQ